MTIEELAKSFSENKVSDSIKDRYANIRKIRKEQLRKGFLCNKENKAKYLVTVAGVDFLDATNVENLNAAWFLFEKINKNIILILNKGNVYDKDIKKVVKPLGTKIKDIIFTENTEEEISQNVNIARNIATIDDCVIFTSFDSDTLANKNGSEIFEKIVFSM